MDIKIETFNGDGSLNTSRVSCGVNPDYEAMVKKQTGYGMKAEVVYDDNGDFVSYTEYPEGVLGIHKYKITLVQEEYNGKKSKV